MKKTILLLSLLMSINNMCATVISYYAKVTASDGAVSWLRIDTEWNSRWSRYDTFSANSAQRDIKGELDLDEIWTESGGTGTKITVSEIDQCAFYGFSGLTSIKGTSVKILRSQAFQGCSSLTSINFPNLQTIEAYTFAYCSSLASYNIPASVTSIDGSAFASCSSLTNLTVSTRNLYFTCEDNILYNKAKTSLYIYLPCKTDTTFVVPPTIKAIGSNAFRYTNLKSVVISNGVETIGQNAFVGPKLLSVYLPQSITEIGSNAFSQCISLKNLKVANSSPISLNNSVFPQTATLYVPEGSKVAYENAAFWKDVAEIIEYAPSPHIQFADAKVKDICVSNWDYDADSELSEEEAKIVAEIGTQFMNNKDITSFDELRYFTNLKHIAASAFAGCSNLTSFQVPASLLTIGYNAFLNTPWLNSQPDGLLYIGNVLYAYRGSMPSNTKIVVRDGTTSICDDAFLNQNNLVDIELPSSLIAMGTEDEGYVFAGCKGLAEIRIPSGVKKIERYVFYNSGLKTIELPEGLESIGNSSFRSCTSLESIEIPNRVTKIGKNTFRSCTNLKSVTMPYNLQTVATDAFRDCLQLQAVHIPSLEQWISIAFADYRANPLAYAHHLYMNNEEIVNLVIPTASTWSYSGSELHYYPSAINSLVFYGCSYIKTVTIPKSISSIGVNAFQGCSSLTAVKVERAPFELNNSAFPTKTSITVYSPKIYASQYETANVWSTFKAIKSYPDNDVNNDKNIDVLDVVDIIRYAKGNPSETFDVFLADLNSDKTIDVDDAKQEIGRVAYSTTLTTFQHESGQQSNRIKFANYEERARKTCAVDIALDNASNDLVGFQMDVTLPEGLSLNTNTCRLSGRISGSNQELTVSNIGNSSYRLTYVSLSLQPIVGKEGELISLALDAADMTVGGVITVNNIRFVTSNSERIVLENTELAIQPVEDRLFCEGDGTEQNPYLIVDASDFVNLAKDVNGGTTYEGMFFKVAKPEIDFSGISYNSIGNIQYVSNQSVIKSFNGSFDGDDVVIKNLSATNGLFGYLGKKGIVKKVVIDESCMINGTASNTAGIAGISEGSIEYCVNKASISSTKYHVAGICGDNMGTIMNCKNYGTITSTYSDCSMIGGIAGDVDSGKILNCDNYGVIMGSSSWVGGIVGLVTGNNNVVSDCTNKGNVQGRYIVGGIYGYYSELTGTLSNNLVMSCTITGTSSYDPIGAGAVGGTNSNRLSHNYYTEDVIVKVGEQIYKDRTPRGVWDYNAPKDLTEDSGAMLLVDGDVNGDGAVDIADAVNIVNYVVGKANTSFVEQAADVNSDGVVDIADAVRIVNLVVGKIDALARKMEWNTHDPQ